MPTSAIGQALRPLANRKLLVGLSGGLDSTVLLHALAAERAELHSLRAVHVDHGLHGDSAAWAASCRHTCTALGIELAVETVTVHASGRGPEAAARDARYAAFARHLREGEALVLAHHADDQAETVLLRLLRASGSDGLAAMRPSRPFAGGVLLRPLLHLPRRLLLEYATAQALHWVEDPSNTDLRPDRNFIRHRVLPVLAGRWPQAGAALGQSAALLAEDADLLAREADRRLQAARTPLAHRLSIAALLAMDAAWRHRALRSWLAGLGMPPLPGAAFGIIDAQLLQSRTDGHACYRWAGHLLRRWRDVLDAGVDASLQEPAAWTCNWDGGQTLVLPDGGRLSFVSGPAGAPLSADVPALLLHEALGPLCVRTRQGGERIRLAGRTHSHSLKHCLQEAGVAPWLRARLPLLHAADGELLAAGECLLSDRLARFCATQDLRLRHQPPSRD